MFLDPQLYSSKPDPQESVQCFFEKTIPKMDWGPREEPEAVMDIGCGPGRVTATMVLPLFSNLEKLYAIDMLPNMVEYAETHNSHPEIEYSLGSIEEWSTVKRWEGRMSKVFSIHCFSWLKNQRQGFENVYRILQPGGQAAFLLCLHTPFYQAVVDIAADPKWKKYFENVHNYVPESHFKKYEALYYKEMMTEIGFSVVHADSRLQEDTFETDELYRNFFASMCVFVSHVPIEEREDFKDDLYKYNIRLNGRNSKGHAIHNATILELVVKKKRL